MYVGYPKSKTGVKSSKFLSVNYVVWVKEKLSIINFVKKKNNYMGELNLLKKHCLYLESSLLCLISNVFPDIENLRYRKSILTICAMMLKKGITNNKICTELFYDLRSKMKSKENFVSSFRIFRGNYASQLFFIINKNGWIFIPIIVCDVHC